MPGAATLPGPTPSPTPSPTGTPEPIDLAAYELPDYARRSLDDVGAISVDSGGIRPDAFGTNGGRGLQTLMRRLDAPLPSRWLSIILRRALVSRVAAPDDINGADFAAERAWLLLRMGEAEAARAVVQSVDVENYTPKLFQVAMQAMLATGDPAGLCPLVDPAMQTSNETGWRFARAMCTALGGKAAEAGAQLDAARRASRTGRSIDALLAEKVVGAGAQGRRAVTIEWAGVDQLTAWRYGLATATAVAIPDELLAAARPQVALWRATSPMLSPSARASVAGMAASQGVLSNLAIVDLYGDLESTDEGDPAQGALARDMRTAFADGSDDDRLKMLRRIWDGGGSPRDRYARLVLTARAAARIAPSEERVEDAPRLVAAMLSAGLDRGALRWRSVVPTTSDAWAMLALADPRGRTISPGDVDGFASNDASQDRIKARMLAAGLAGLGRLAADDAERIGRDLNIRFGAGSSWTRAIAAAATRRDAGTVLVLIGIGMQTADWRGVPPETLYHACAALRAVGMEGEARMIAAEAIARL